MNIKLIITDLQIKNVPTVLQLHWSALLGNLHSLHVIPYQHTGSGPLLTRKDLCGFHQWLDYELAGNSNSIHRFIQKLTFKDSPSS